MSKIINIKDDEVKIGNEEGKIITVPLATLNFTQPKIGDQVEVFNDNSEIIVNRIEVENPKINKKIKDSSENKNNFLHKIPYKKWQFWTIVGLVVAVIITLVFLVIIPKAEEAARSGVYCRADDDSTYCLTVDGNKIDFGKYILNSRNITGTIVNKNTITFNQDDKDAYEQACSSSWWKSLCSDGLVDKNIVWGDNWIVVDGIRFDKNLDSSSDQTSDNNNAANSNSGTSFSTVTDSGTSKGETKIFHLPAGRYSIKMVTSIDWSNYSSTSSYSAEDIRYELRKCSSSSSYCSYTKSFYTDYFYKNKNDTSNTKSTTFEVDEEGDYKVEVTDEYADGVKITSWAVTIEKL